MQFTFSFTFSFTPSALSNCFALSVAVNFTKHTVIQMWWTLPMKECKPLAKSMAILILFVCVVFVLFVYCLLVCFIFSEVIGWLLTFTQVKNMSEIE